MGMGMPTKMILNLRGKIGNPIDVQPESFDEYGIPTKDSKFTVTLLVNGKKRKIKHLQETEIAKAVLEYSRKILNDKEAKNDGKT